MRIKYSVGVYGYIFYSVTFTSLIIHSLHIHPCATANLKSFYNTEILNVTYVNGHRTYHTVRDAPTDGRWVAYFIDVKYRNTPTLPAKTSGTRKETNFDNVSELRGFIPTDFARRLEFTSEVSIFPTAYAYADCTGESCGSTLV